MGRSTKNIIPNSEKYLKNILDLTFRRCLQKNNIFLAIVFGKIILKFAFIISTET
jgi:hypothetical protein